MVGETYYRGLLSSSPARGGLSTYNLRVVGGDHGVGEEGQEVYRLM